jgi:predicted metal-dependent HD superfamily phosphohydrolase
MIDALERRWADTADALGLSPDVSRVLFAEIVKRHSDRHRHYHGLTHLKALFDVLQPVWPELADPVRVELAIWFHDIIYRPMRTDNEAKSAALAARRLQAAGVARDLVDRVMALIAATAQHQDGGRDTDDALFLDADFSILGAPPDIYDAYTLGVRKEYRLVPAPMFKAGRAKFLRQALARDRVFHTDYFERTYGDQARENMARELAAIE